MPRPRIDEKDKPVYRPPVMPPLIDETVTPVPQTTGVAPPLPETTAPPPTTTAPPPPPPDEEPAPGVAAPQYDQSIYSYTDWGSWDTGAGQDMSRINEMETALGQLSPALEQLRQRMQQAMHARSIARGDARGDMARTLQQIRVSYVKALDDAWRQMQMNQAQDPTTRTDYQQPELPIPGEEEMIAPNMGDPSIPEDPAIAEWLAEFGQAGPDTTEFDTDVDRPDVETGETPIPEGGEVDLTTGEGAITDTTLPGTEDWEGGTGPEARGPTEGFERTMFEDQAREVLSTGNPELDDMLVNMVGGGDTKAMEAIVEAYVTAQLNADPDKLTPTQQKHLDSMLKRVNEGAQKIADMGFAELGVSGRRGSAIRDWTSEVTTNLGRDLVESELGYRVGVGKENRAQRSADVKATMGFIKAIQANDSDKAKLLLDTRSRDLDRELEASQSQAKYDILRENAMLGRDEFTEKQRQALRDEGFSDRQIANAEQEMRWNQAFEEMKYVADHNLAVRNTDIAEKVKLGELDIKDIRNRFDMSLADRVQSLTEELGRENVNQIWERLQKEFGLNLNKFELEKWVKTGEMNQNILNSQRAFNLAESEQYNKWETSKAALAIQETLGWGELQLKEIMQGKALDLEQDRLYVQQFMGLLGIDTQVHEAALDRAFQRWQTEYAAGEAGKAREGSFISSIISSAVEAGMDWALPTP